MLFLHKKTEKTEILRVKKKKHKKIYNKKQ